MRFVAYSFAEASPLVLGGQYGVGDNMEHFSDRLLEFLMASVSAVAEAALWIADAMKIKN